MTREQSGETAGRGPQNYVIILDGTLSTLEPGYETHAGVTYRLCREMSPHVAVYYESGVQWPDWRSTPDMLMGRGIDRQIRRAYGFLSSRYRPGDRVFLFGYSRGAYAVRALAGLIDRVGLLQRDHATVRNIRTAYRHYENAPDGLHARAFARALCHQSVPIQMIGAWDTVKALGIRLPLLWRFAAEQHRFHDHHPGGSVRNVFHALALHETRVVYQPELWRLKPDWQGYMEQVWFRGAHGDIGGQLGGDERARPLANIPLVWMLERAETAGLPLPQGWNARFFTDASAAPVGTWRGWSKIFLLRRPRLVGVDPSERLHETVPEQMPAQTSAPLGAPRPQ
nr:DUF2235 domain-containing protein [Pontibaca salina]